MSKTSGMWGGRILVICVLVFTTSGCAWSREQCGGKSKAQAPETIRTPDFFGVMDTYSSVWARAAYHPNRLEPIKVGDRTLRVDAKSELIPSGGCQYRERCGLFVGLRADGKTIDWALVATTGEGDLVVNGTGWKISDRDIVLSEGVRLALDPGFAVTNCELGNNEREDAEGASFFHVSSETGRVLGASCPGCD